MSKQKVTAHFINELYELYYENGQAVYEEGGFINAEDVELFCSENNLELVHVFGLDDENPFDFLLNEEEGWGVFYTGKQDAVHNLWELQRIDELNKFADDDAAMVFVAQKALDTPASTHREVIRFLRDCSPNELDRLETINPELFSAISHEIL